MKKQVQQQLRQRTRIQNLPSLDEVNVDTDEEMDESESSSQELNIVDDSLLIRMVFLF